MKHACLVVAAVTLALLAVPASAEIFVITVPGQGWRITFDGPTMSRYAGQTKGDDFVFQATGAGHGYNLSVFVEKPRDNGDTNEDVYDFYWPQAKQNPLVDQKSVKVEKTDHYIRVTYNQVIPGGLAGGKDLIHANANYYFAFEGRWIDVHVSAEPAEKAPDRPFDAFEKSLTYEKSPAAPATRPAE